MQNINTWEKYSEVQLKDCEKFCKGYMDFLSTCKTERECVSKIVSDIEEAGYLPLDEKIKNHVKLKTGDKVYAVNMDKAVVMFNIGEESIENGLNILGAHIDSPRMDIKQNPLYEEGGFAYLDTHYYGGIKKYQWVAMPLALHGVVIKKNGDRVNISIGERADEPVFFVSDLLIHLAQEQMDKKAAKVIEGEALDIIVGNKPILIKGEEVKDKDKVKQAILEILCKHYGFDEEDFVSAELEVVPAGAAREAGFTEV